MAADKDFDENDSFLADVAKVEPRFWQKKKLADMNETEWELLCDGCGKCCLNKIDINGKIYFTCLRCCFLDDRKCRCRIYEHRFEKVSDCRKVDLAAVKEKPRWLPKTCAYWLLANGKDLPPWHPLVTGDAQSVHRAGQSVRGRLIISETGIVDYENYVVDWKDI